MQDKVKEKGKRECSLSGNCGKAQGSTVYLNPLFDFHGPLSFSTKIRGWDIDI